MLEKELYEGVDNDPSLVYVVMGWEGESFKTSLVATTYESMMALADLMMDEDESIDSVTMKYVQLDSPKLATEPLH